jgi:hypothetical protein
VEQNFHGTDDQLEQYALGRLPESDLPPVEEHLMICAACRERLDGIGDFAVGMREALALPDPDPELASTNTEQADLPRKGPARADWSGWLHNPAFSMAVGFALLLIVVGIFSSNRTTYAPSASLQLTAMRGEMPLAVPAREFDLTLADGPREGGPFRVSVVNALGATMWSGLAVSGPSGVKAAVQQPLAPGDYFVRLYSSSDAILHEYGFRIRP